MFDDNYCIYDNTSVELNPFTGAYNGVPKPEIKYSSYVEPYLPPWANKADCPLPA